MLSVINAGSPREEYEHCLLCDITLPNYKSGPSLIPACVLIAKAKQIPNKHSSKGLVSKHSLAAFLVGLTPCWHLAGAFHNFWTWLIFTSLEPISAEYKSSESHPCKITSSHICISSFCSGCRGIKTITKTLRNLQIWQTVSSFFNVTYSLVCSQPACKVFTIILVHIQF